MNVLSGLWRSFREKNGVHMGIRGAHTTPAKLEQNGRVVNCVQKSGSRHRDTCIGEQLGTDSCSCMLGAADLVVMSQKI